MFSTNNARVHLLHWTVFSLSRVHASVGACSCMLAGKLLLQPAMSTTPALQPPGKTVGIMHALCVTSIPAPPSSRAYFHFR